MEIVVMVGPEIRVDLGEEKEDLLEEVNFKGKSLTRAQQLGDLRVSGKAVDKDKDRCYHCHQPGQFAAECPEKDKGSSQKPTEGKKFEDYTYAYGGAEEPQLATATALPQAYEDALAAMQQSLKNQDPLHGLNM